ncbi:MULTISPECIES: DUF397 domain-containing protein [unclassified Streptomyces]|uniref:DUF397 domain-containing protein n=1 Tax=unclassified Streptomyces TaxID=2593676 RepID=UPI00342256A4
MTLKPSAEGGPELPWRKSTYSDSSNSSECVEIAPTPTAIHVRDSKNPGGGRLAMAPAAWTAFVAAL